MRAEIVPLEMAVDLDQAWADNAARLSSSARNMPALLAQSGEEARVTIEQVGGLAIVYGLDRRIPDLNDSAYDMITLAIGNVKLVLTTDEWTTLATKVGNVITAGRVGWKAAFGEKDGADV